MLIFGPQLLSLAILVFLATCIQADNRIGTLFESLPSGIEGSCLDKGLLEVIEETKTITNNAIHVLRELQRGPVPNNVFSVRKLNAASAMFGIRYGLVGDEQLEVVSGKELLKEAQTHFTEFYTLLTNDQPESSLWKLECGDKDLRYANTLGDLSANQSATKDTTSLTTALSNYYSDTSQDLLTFKGLFFSDYWSPKSSDDCKTYDWKNAYYLRPGPREAKETSFCASWGCYALASDGGGRKPFGARSLVLCEALFSLLALSKAKSLQRRAQSIDQLMTKAGILLHEGLHIATMGEVDDISIQTGGKTIVCLDWAECVQCANAEDRKYNGEAVKNADSYKLFAEAVYLAKVDWWPEGWRENIKC